MSQTLKRGFWALFLTLTAWAKTPIPAMMTPEYHFSMARAYSLEGDGARAIAEYRLALLLDPQSLFLKNRLALEYIKNQDWDLARGLFLEVLQTENKKTPTQSSPGVSVPAENLLEYQEARMALASLNIRVQLIPEAKQLYEEVLKRDPFHEEAILSLVHLLSQEGHLEEAAQRIKKWMQFAESMESPQRKAFFYYSLGLIQSQQKKEEEAIRSYQKAVDLYPDFFQAQLALGALYEGLGRHADAVAVYQRMKSPLAAHRMADIYLKEKAFSKAVPYLEQIQAADPGDMRTQIQLGLVHRESKQYELAIQVFQSILNQYPDSDRVHFYLGGLYEETQQGSLAIEAFRKVPQDSEFYADAVLHGAYQLKLLKHFSEAKAWLKEALDAAEKDQSIGIQPGFYVFLASVEEEEDSSPVGIGKAIQQLEKGMQRYPEEEKLLYYLGSLYDRQGQGDQGLNTMNRLLEINPEHTDALNYVGYTLTVQKRDLERAEGLLRKAVAIEPKNAYILDSLGWNLFVRGKVSEALKLLLQAVQQKGEEAIIREHLGDVYLHLGNLDHARLEYQAALRGAELSPQKRQELEEKLKSLNPQTRP